MKSFLQKFVATVVLMAFTGAANAGMIMYLDDLSTTGIDAIVGDNFTAGVSTSKGVSTSGDAIGALGALGYSGLVGSFIVNVTTGISKPIINGGPGLLSLNSINVTGGSGGDLKIGLTDTNYMGPTGLAFGFGGFSNGTVSVEAWLDSGNQEFGMTTLLGSTTEGPGVYSYSSGQTITNASLYSLTIESIITHAAGGRVSSFGAEIRIPEPSIIALFALGLLGLGLARRKSRV